MLIYCWFVVVCFVFYLCVVLLFWCFDCFCRVVCLIDCWVLLGCVIVVVFRLLRYVCFTINFDLFLGGLLTYVCVLLALFGLIKLLFVYVVNGYWIVDWFGVSLAGMCEGLVWCLLGLLVVWIVGVLMMCLRFWLFENFIDVCLILVSLTFWFCLVVGVFGGLFGGFVVLFGVWVCFDLLCLFCFDAVCFVCGCRMFVGLFDLDLFWCLSGC